MARRLLVATVVFLAVAGQAAVAAGAEVSVRVEGLTRTIFEGRVTTSVHPVNGGDGSGPHTCSGSFGEAASTTLTGALDDALREAGIDWRGSWDPSAGDFLISSIGGEEATPAMPWSTLLNGVPTPTGGCTTKVVSGDRVLLAYDAVFKPVTLSLSGQAKVAVGEEFAVTATDDRADGGPVAGASITGNGTTSVTGNDGRATFTIDEPGEYRFKAEHPDAIRSNSVTVCVGIESPGCDVREPPPRPLRIGKIIQGQRFLRGAGPRILRGKVFVAGRVEVAIRRTSDKARKRSLVWRPVESEGDSWSRRLAPLRPGSYRLFGRVIGTAGQPWVTGVNRVDFTIARKRLNRKRFAGRTTSYLRRAAGTRTVRSSRLLRGWTRIALGGTSNGAKTLLGRQLSQQMEDGSFGGDVNRTAMAVIAISTTRPVDAERAAGWIALQQKTDGGFGFGNAPVSDVDTSGLAAWALALTGYWAQVEGAARFIRPLQGADGGFPAVAGGGSNAQSTGLAMVALRMSGRAPIKVRTEDRISPVHYLAALQRKNGAIDYAPGLVTTPSWVTAQARLGITSRAGLLP